MRAWRIKLLMIVICSLNVATASELLVPSLNQEDWLNAERFIHIQQTPIGEDDLLLPDEPSITPAPVIDAASEQIQTSLQPEADLSSQLEGEPPIAPNLERQELVDILNQLPKDQRDFIEGFVDSDLFFVVEFLEQDTLTQEQKRIADAIASSLTSERQTVEIIMPDAANPKIKLQIQRWMDYLKSKANFASITTQQADERQRPILQNRRIFITIKE